MDAAFSKIHEIIGKQLLKCKGEIFNEVRGFVHDRHVYWATIKLLARCARDELMSENERLREELHQAQKALIVWKGQYYNLKHGLQEAEWNKVW